MIRKYRPLIYAQVWEAVLDTWRARSRPDWNRESDSSKQYLMCGSTLVDSDPGGGVDELFYSPFSDENNCPIYTRM